MNHSEQHAAAQVLNNELAVTGKFLSKIAQFFGAKADPSTTRGKAAAQDVFEDLYYPNETALRS